MITTEVELSKPVLRLKKYNFLTKTLTVGVNHSTVCQGPCLSVA